MDSPGHVVPRLMGGLGNQIFQVVAAAAYGARTGRRVFLPPALAPGGTRRTLYRGMFGAHARLPLAQRWCRRDVHVERRFAFDPIPEYPAVGVELVGYFQSERYFDGVEPREVMRPPRGVAEAAARALERLRAWAEDRPLVAVHVRRGDYRALPDYHPVLPEAYYTRALALFGRSEAFVVFSDDIASCRTWAPFAGLPRCTFVDAPAETALLAMAGCDHHVLANSTFGWWGARLAPVRGTVLVPSRWFGPSGPADASDLIPPEWERLECA